MWFLNLLNPLGAIGKSLAEAYAAKQNATTDQARIAADATIKTLEARRDVLVAESRHPWNVAMRGFLAMPTGILLWKVMVWDKTIGGFTAVSEDVWHVVWIVLGFYFLSEITNRIMR